MLLCFVVAVTVDLFRGALGGIILFFIKPAWSVCELYLVQNEKVRVWPDVGESYDCLLFVRGEEIIKSLVFPVNVDI